MDRKAVATYSLVACDLAASQWGVAVQSKFLAVGSVVPWAEPHVGAIATQSYANPRYGPEGLALLRDGRTAPEVVDALTSADKAHAERQVGVVDGHQRPIAELRRLFSLHRELFGVPPQEDWLDVDDTLARELRDRLTKLGYGGDLERAFADWAGAANLEERVDGLARIDPIVLT